MPPRADLLPGTLDLLILKAVSLGPLHGYAVLLRIEQITGGALLVEQGALYPGLFRLEHRGLLESEWGVSDNNRRAKYLPADRSRPPAVADRTRELEPASGRYDRRPRDTRRRGVTRCGLAFARGSAVWFGAGASNETWRTKWSSICGSEPSTWVRQGLPQEEAARRARIEFGAVERHKDDCREALGLRLVDEISGDIVYGLRKMRAAPTFTIVAVSILALSIGANAAVFSALEAVVLRMLPVERPRDLRELAWIDRRDSPLKSHVHRRRRLDLWRCHVVRLSGLYAGARPIDGVRRSVPVRSACDQRWRVGARATGPWAFRLGQLPSRPWRELKHRPLDRAGRRSC